MTLRIELDGEEEGRWIATVAEIPGVSKYGVMRDEVVQTVKVLALQVVAGMLEHGELKSDLDGVQFAKAA